MNHGWSICPEKLDVQEILSFPSWALHLHINFLEAYCILMVCVDFQLVSCIVVADELSMRVFDNKEITVLRHKSIVRRLYMLEIGNHSAVGILIENREPLKLVNEIIYCR